MINAWIQRLLTLCAVLLAWGVGGALWAEHPWLAYLCFLAPAFVAAVPIAGQFIVLWMVNHNDPAPRASLSDHLLAFWGELVIAIKVFNWWQPFRRAAIADGLDAASLASGQRGVVLVHGFFCNRAFWTPWMRRLQAQQRPFVALDLEPPFGSIDDYCATLDRAVRQLHELTGLAPLLVGHSMGGLAIRAWWASTQRDPASDPSSSAGTQPHETPDLRLVHRIVTIGTPHQGTWLARFSLTTNGGQMRQGSRWLTALERSAKTAKSVEYICFYSNCDNIVFPVSFAKLQGADNRLIRGRGHVDMASDPALLDACWSLMQ